MARDIYSRPPRPAGAGAVTRRALLRLGPPARRDPAETTALRAAIAAAATRPGAAEFARAIEPAARVLSELAGATEDDGRLEVSALEDLESATGPVAAVTSAFGIAQDPEPERAVSDMTRVAAPGGVVAITAWVPRGLPGRLTEFAEALVPLPPGVPSPAEWGRVETATSRLERALHEVQVRTRTVRLVFPDPDAAFAAIAAPLPFPESRLDELRPPFDRLLASCNDALDGVEIAGRYLIAAGRKPATG
jgi:SAM-dependent methyltransferase